MQSLEQAAKTVDDAIALALKKLGASRDQVEIRILSEGRSGIFGLGAEDARVVVTLKEPDAPPEPARPGLAQPALATTAEELDAGQEILEELLHLMQLDAKVNLRPAEGDHPAVLDVSGEDLGILIGRRGETLSSLQFLLNLLVSKRLGRQVRIPIDVESYRSRRESSLRSLAARLAERVAQTGQPVALEEMPPLERRIVHLALADHPAVMTQSTGEGERRKVVILPRQ